MPKLVYIVRSIRRLGPLVGRNRRRQSQIESRQGRLGDGPGRPILIIMGIADSLLRP